MERNIFRYKVAKHNYNFRFSMGEWASEPSPMQQKQLRISLMKEQIKTTEQKTQFHRIPGFTERRGSQHN